MGPGLRGLGEHRPWVLRAQSRWKGAGGDGPRLGCPAGSDFREPGATQRKREEFLAPKAKGRRSSQDRKIRGLSKKGR